MMFMTFGKWDSHTSCVDDMMANQGYDEETAHRVCAWLEHEITGSWPSEKELKKGEKQVDEKINDKASIELTGPIFKKDTKQRIVYAAVLVPGEPDYDYEKGEKILTAEEIEYVAHKWLEDYGNIDYMHGLNNVAKPVETYILPFDWEVEIAGEKTNLPKGTWILAGKVTNDKAWKEVEEGKLTGFSIMGIQNTVLKDILKDAAENKQVGKSFEAAMKKTLLRDLGENWIVPFVSLVDEPCVPKAKFFAIKAKEEEAQKEKDKKENSAWNKLVTFFKKDDDFEQLNETVSKMKNMIEKAGRSISDESYKELKAIYEALSRLMEKAEKERKPKYMKSKNSENLENSKNLEGDELDMDIKDVEKMIDEKLDAKLEPILKALTKDEGDGNAEKKQENEKETETETKNEKMDEVEKLKDENSNYQKIIETLKAEKAKLEAEKAGKVKSEKGQDGNKPEPYTVTKMYKELKRDAYGRAIKEEEE